MKKLILLLMGLLCSTPIFGQAVDEIELDRGFRDYFTQSTDFSLAFARYQTRGYGVNYEGFRINGINFRNIENRHPLWGSFVGYNSSIRNYGFYRGNEFGATGEYIGNIGGGEYVTTKRYDERLMRVVGSVGSRTYSYRLGATYANGWDNGLSIVFDIGRRWGRSLSIQGVWSDMWSGSINVNKIFKGGKHELDFNLILTPGKRAVQRFSVDEAFELTDNTLYNPNWGYQNGKERSARWRTHFVPLATLAHTYNISDKSKLITTLGAAVGTMAYSALNWQNAPNPNPDYYRYLPSYQTNKEAKELVADLWRNNPNTSQINYERIYALNRKDQAYYIEEERMSEYGQFTLQSIFSTKFGNNTITAGVEATYWDELRYKRLSDLMGAKYWIDIDYFLESDDDYRELTQNDMQNPNRKIGVGDSFGYRYRLKKLETGAWFAYEYNIKNWYIRLGGSAKYHTLSREGYYEKENFPGNQSLGKSKTFSMIEGRVKAMLEYRFANNFSAQVALAYMYYPPTVRNSFIDANYRNAFVYGLKGENIYSGQVGVKYANSFLRIGLSLYGTNITNSTEVKHFYDDLDQFYCDYVVSDITKFFMGGEFSFQARLTPDLWLNLATAITSNRYSKNAIGTQYRQTDGVNIRSEELLYKDLYVPLSPQSIINAGIEYKPQGWNVSLMINGFSSSYVSLAPIRHTERAKNRTANRDYMTEQESLPAGYTIDLTGGKTFQFNNFSRLGIYAGIYNIANSHNKVAGYQTDRLLKDSRGLYNPMPDKFSYGLGINFNLSITYSF